MKRAVALTAALTANLRRWFWSANGCRSNSSRNLEFEVGLECKSAPQPNKARCKSLVRFRRVVLEFDGELWYNVATGRCEQRPERMVEMYSPKNGFTKRTHGLRSTYVDGCRCHACTWANRVYFGAYRARKSRVPYGLIAESEDASFS